MMRRYLTVGLFSFMAWFGLALWQPVMAQTEPGTTPTDNLIEAVLIEEVAADGSAPVDEQGNSIFQYFKATITDGDQKGQTVTAETGGETAQGSTFEVGDKVMLHSGYDANDQIVYRIADHIRRGPLLLLFLIFIGITLFINRTKGLLSLVSMGLTFGVIFIFILPQILAGRDPILITLAASLVIIPVSYYLSHGLNRKTTMAVVGTLTALVFSVTLAQIFISAGHLTGFASDEAGMLAFMTGDIQLNLQGLLMAGIVLGLSGVLDDVTVSQSSIVQQLREAQPNLSTRELYDRAMQVGKDHISSLVNTLVLVYTSAAMPLLLLFMLSEKPAMELINYEIVAEEIIRTLVVSIGIILSVPLTTFIATFGYQWYRGQRPPETQAPQRRPARGHDLDLHHGHSH